jgi:hypothetical protein
VLEQQEQNARRLFAQLDDGAIAAQFSTRGVQFEDAEAPGPWSVDRHAHEHAPLGWRNFTPFLMVGPAELEPAIYPIGKVLSSQGRRTQ